MAAACLDLHQQRRLDTEDPRQAAALRRRLEALASPLLDSHLAAMRAEPFLRCARACVCAGHAE
eukprot:4548023-Pyramimonas_sp.AAC.1